MALTYTPETPLGSALPDFQLPTIYGESFSSAKLSAAPAVVIAFICAHCPYVQAIEDRLIQLNKDLAEKDIPFIGICSNDPQDYPEDSPAALRERSELKKYGFPYLVDADQKLAKTFGAVCTPDFFIYDSSKKLRYRGRLDDSWKDPSKVKNRELYAAALAIANDRPIEHETTPSMGCSIKWKEN